MVKTVLFIVLSFSLILPSFSYAGKQYDASGNLIKSSWGSAKHKSHQNRPAAVHGMKGQSASGSQISSIKALKKAKMAKKKCKKSKNVYSAAAGRSGSNQANCPDDDN